MNSKKIKLGEAATFINGYPFKPSEWSTEGLEIIRIQNLTKSNSSESNYYKGTLPEKYKVQNGDILISWSGTLDIFEWTGNDAWLNQHIFKVQFDKLDIEKRFFKYAIINLIDSLRKQVHGATMQHITKGKFDSTEVFVPEKATQKRIAEILDKADALRKKDQQLLQYYDDVAQSLFVDMFGNHSTVVKLNTLCSKITDGVHSKPSYVETGVPFLSVKNATDKYLNFSNCKFITEENHNNYIKRCKPEYNDILYTKVGATYGRAALITEQKPFSIYVSLALIKPIKELVSSEYLTFVMNSQFVKKQADKRVKGAGVPDLHLVEIKDFDIILPPLSLQNAFTEIIQNIERQKQKVKAQMQQSENLFQALLQQAFNGDLN